MSVWKVKCGGAEFRIADADHLPPHCHVRVSHQDVKVNIYSLTPLHPVRLSSGLRACLKKHQADMVTAWDKVKVVPAGRSWEFEE